MYTILKNQLNLKWMLLSRDLYVLSGAVYGAWQSKTSNRPSNSSAKATHKHLGEIDGCGSLGACVKSWQTHNESTQYCIEFMLGEQETHEFCLYPGGITPRSAWFWKRKLKIIAVRFDCVFCVTVNFITLIPASLIPEIGECVSSS